MARRAEPAVTTHPSRYRLAIFLVAGAIVLGLAAGALSYLGSSLVVGPEVRAGADELRERGGQIYFESCAGFAEPRFWPECSGDAGENRMRGASALVAFCTGRDRGNRFFGPDDCLADDRPPLALTASPSEQDAAAGGMVAGGSFVALVLLAVLARVLVPAGRRSTTGGRGTAAQL